MLRVALFGAGRIGQVHARSIVESGEAELAWVCDPVEAAASALATKYGARWSPEPGDAIEDASVDAVLIASATATHTDLLRASVLGGKKVLCEKPIDLDMARIDATWAAIADKAPFVMLGFNRRFDPAFREVNERVAGGRDRPHPRTARHQPRPAAPSRRLPRRLGRHVPRHDHPRLRHGPVLPGRDRRGVGARQPQRRPGLHRGERPRAGDRDDAQPRQRAVHDREQPVLRVRLRPAPRGVRRPRLARGRQPDRRPRSGRSTRERPRRRARSSTSSSSATCPPTRPSSPSSSRRSRRTASPTVGFADGRAALVLAEAAIESVATGKSVAVTGG